ncbi:MAG: NnrU family protein [Xanthomonadaceae bacterium]|nr:NnrU family protein [Xanthomonadaceae bacterium]
MSQLILGLVLFLGVHSIAIVAPAWRNRLAARGGGIPWKIVYALVSIVGFVMIVRGYADARLAPELLYSPPRWTRHLMATLMLPVFPLLLAAYLPGRIKALAGGHPMLVATKLWALSHLFGNTTVADAVLFGSILAWAVADFISVRRRPARAIPGAPASKWNDAIAVVLGLALYGAFVGHLHLKLIGIAPFG